MNKLEKQELIETLKQRVNNKNFILSGFRGLTVFEIEEVRNKLRGANCATNVIKNRLLLLALKELNIGGFEDSLTDATMLTVLNEPNSFQGLKIIADYVKVNEKMFIKAGYVEGKKVDQKGIVSIANLPSREVLIAKLLAQLQSPISKFVFTLNNPLAKLVYALIAIKNKRN